MVQGDRRIGIKFVEPLANDVSAFLFLHAQSVLYFKMAMFSKISIPVLNRLCVSASLVFALVSVALGETSMSIVHSNDVSISTDGQEIQLVTTGQDPYVVWKCSANLAESGDHVVAFEYFARIFAIGIL